MNYYQHPYFYNPAYGLCVNPVFGMPNPEQAAYFDPAFTPQPGMNAENKNYLDNILKMNIGKIAAVYTHFNNSQWGSKIFKGIILGTGCDHLILKDVQSETRYVLLLNYINYVTFEEAVDFDYPYRKKDEKKP